MFVNRKLHSEATGIQIASIATAVSRGKQLSHKAGKIKGVEVMHLCVCKQLSQPLNSVVAAYSVVKIFHRHHPSNDTAY